MNFVQKEIVRGSMNGGERIKMYVIVDPVKAKVVLIKYALVKNLDDFAGWQVKKTIKGRYFISQNSAFKFQTMERIYNVMDTAIDFYQKYKNSLK